MNHLLTISKSDGTKQLFEEDKLISSLERTGASKEVVEDIVDEVEKGMRDGMQTEEIYRRAFESLKKRSAHAAVKYSLRRAIIELGPDGFPFEKFVARVFQTWGYQTLTDQTVLGSCISHEVDVIAWNEKKLIMVEAKFHNEFGLKSDSKVALYIKARWDDIAPNMFDYGGIKRKTSEYWLVTNTKFTDQAIIYSECKGLHLIGWNYPTHGNLHEIIDENGLQPITCLTTITHQQKKDLVGRNVLVCVDLIEKPGMLTLVGVKEKDIPQVIEEARLIVRVAK